MSTTRLPFVTVETQCPAHGVMRRSLSPEGVARLPKGCPTCAKGSGPKRVAHALHPSKWEKFASATQVPVGQGWRTSGEKKPPTLPEPPCGGKNGAQLEREREQKKPAPAPAKPAALELDYPKCATEGCLREVWIKDLCDRCYQRKKYRDKHPEVKSVRSITPHPCGYDGCTAPTTGKHCKRCTSRKKKRDYAERQRARGLA